MKLSIVTINRNNAEGLRKTLASVAAQTYRDIEHIIIDGGSTDGSVDVIKEFEQTIHHTSHTENGYPSIFYGNMLKSYDGKTIIHRDTCGGDMYTPESFLYFYNGTLNHDCAYIRRDLFEKYGLYNEEMKICSDWE